MRRHVVARRSGAARHATALALVVAHGCTPEEASVLVVVGDTAGRAVIASPLDPRTVRAATFRERAQGAVVTAIARYYAALDSADSLDTVFQRARDELNRDAKRLMRGDRRAPEYGGDYDAYMDRLAIATGTREARDRLRRRAAALREQLRLELRSDTQVFSRLRSGLDSAARVNGGRILRTELRDRRGALDLEPGVWWLAVEHDGGLLGATRRHHARAGARDTVRIGS